MIVMNSGGFAAAFFMAHLIKFSNLYGLTWRNPKLFAMEMGTTVELSLGLDHISLTIRSKSYLLVLCRGGAHGKSQIVQSIRNTILFWWIFDRCDAHWSDLDSSEAGRRALKHTEALLEAVGEKSLWDDYGIISDILVCRLSFYLNL
jgi:hypothetical protein